MPQDKKEALRSAQRAYHLQRKEEAADTEVRRRESVKMTY
jgi:hypothetical protein